MQQENTFLDSDIESWAQIKVALPFPCHAAFLSGGVCRAC